MRSAPPGAGRAAAAARRRMQGTSAGAAGQELKSLGAWWNKATGRYQPPTKSTIHRVVMDADAEALEATLQRYTKPRLPAPGEQEQRQALAADGKRIRGANRNGTLRYETATLVEHTTGMPLASLNFHDHNGELAAVGALLEVVPISGALLTLDALHTTRDTAASIVEQHGADLSADRQEELSRDLRGAGNHAMGTWLPGASVKTRRRATGASTVAISKC